MQLGLDVPDLGVASAYLELEGVSLLYKVSDDKVFLREEVALLLEGEL